MICGLTIDDKGTAHIRERDADGASRDTIDDTFRLFVWSQTIPQEGGIEVTQLDGKGELSYLLHFADPATYRKVASDRELSVEAIKPAESQYLIHNRARFFTGATVSRLKRVTLEVATADTPDADPRITAIGCVTPDGKPEVLTPADDTPASEKAMLVAFAERILQIDPDILEGHNAYAALDALVTRLRHHHIAQPIGRFGYNAASRKSRMRIAERWIDYQRIDIPGRSVFDTSLATQVYDITARELPGYDLEEVAEYFEAPNSGEEIPDDIASSEAVVRRARLARAVADILLPTYFAQAQNIPMPLQEVCLRGSSSKVDSLIFERYYHARHSLPGYPPGSAFEGAFSHSFETGVYHNVMHYDVASLYPSLLLALNRAPQGDALNVFIPLLNELRTLRLEYKRMARDAETAELRALYGSRQQSFKILINSFYGYLGFPQARFADPALAAEITRQGRELIQTLIARFQTLGCKVLEADTDGIYLVSDAHRDRPEALLALVADILPQGVNLEFDGYYKSMFCYKAKNYALLDGDKIHMRGSSFRSRGIEPYLKKLTTYLIRWLLGAETRPADELVAEYRSRIASGKMDIHELARSEYLSMTPEAYKKKMEEGGKPRRASLEVALRMTKAPAAGKRVSYYILPKEKGRASDWQRARPLSEYNPATAPYAPDYYLDKLDEWQKRYAPFMKPDGPVQNELSL
jgi:DNA polymerase, archaea type